MVIQHNLLLSMTYSQIKSQSVDLSTLRPKTMDPFLAHSLTDLKNPVIQLNEAIVVMDIKLCVINISIIGNLISII